MKESELRELYVDELKDIYNAENQLVKALPKMAKAATLAELKSGFEKHLEQTKGHVARWSRSSTLSVKNQPGKSAWAWRV